MADPELRDLSVDFSIEMIKLCENTKWHYSLTNQLERAATSIGANVHEANHAQSKADFISKLQIPLKECYETEYWLELFQKSSMIDLTLSKGLFEKCGTIRRILIASINTAKKNNWHFSFFAFVSTKAVLAKSNRQKITAEESRSLRFFYFHLPGGSKCALTKIN